MTSLFTDPSATLTVLADAAGTSGTGGADSSDGPAVLGFILLLLIALVVVAYLALFLGSLVSVLRSRNLTAGGKLLWVIAIFVFQLLGPLVWFLWGRGAQLSRYPPYRR